LTPVLAVDEGLGARTEVHSRVPTPTEIARGSGAVDHWLETAVEHGVPSGLGLGLDGEGNLCPAVGLRLELELDAILIWTLVLVVIIQEVFRQFREGDAGSLKGGAPHRDHSDVAGSLEYLLLCGVIAHRVGAVGMGPAAATVTFFLFLLGC